MNVLHEVASGLRKMFVADTCLAIGILAVVSLAGLQMRLEAAASLVGGAILLLGCVTVLIASVVLSSRRYRDR